jgi:hypothetical protein
MAAPNFTSGQRQDVYRLMFLLNRSFNMIVQRLDELARTRIANPKYLREMSGLTQEVQLEINTLLLDPLSTTEERDWAHFGKVRNTLEKRLKGKG